MSSSTRQVISSFCFLFLSIAFAHIQPPPPCSDDFLDPTKTSRNSSITKCKKLRTLGAEFGWSYNNYSNGDIHISILFGVRVDDFYSNAIWIAWGVNPENRPKMVGTKAIIGIKQSNNSMLVNNYNITRDTKLGCRLRPSPDSDLGLQVKNKKMSYDNGSSFLTIYADVILPSSHYDVNKLNHVWQVGYDAANDEPLIHPAHLQNVDSTEMIDLNSGNGHSGGRHQRYLRTVHGILNILGWGTLLPLGVIVARYMRVYPVKSDLWFCLHLTFQISGYILGTAGWGLGLWLGHASKYYGFYIHRIFAIFIFTFTTIQMLALRLRPKKTDDYRKYWNMYHHLLGYALLTVIIINIFKGINIMKGVPNWKWAYIAILIFLSAVTLCFEIFTWTKFLLQKASAQITAQQSPKDPQKPMDVKDPQQSEPNMGPSISGNDPAHYPTMQNSPSQR
ncbi:Cytochrome b561 and DOMON domain-containing protein [Quillaja saponaria]|uniref:Cytochrome b561 and DOMON domain-containing protein n=1 Tax=Quillaja saponaria TaxID=32244 RepID=A0AAD7LNW7_QUISA|nr:Cytochrome b561 and DOMON domain-containing protein [Quillaja saponaria]